MKNENNLVKLALSKELINRGTKILFLIELLNITFKHNFKHNPLVSIWNVAQFLKPNTKVPKIPKRTKSGKNNSKA